MRRSIKSPAYPENRDGRVLLHVGCGPINSPEFINVDAQPYAHVHVITEDIARLKGFADESADLIYMCHVLEHVKKDEVPSVLAGMYRVLKPGGKLRLSVPDFDQLIAVYHAAANDVPTIINQLMGGQHNEYNIHYSIFNDRYLRSCLLAAGFSEVHPWDPKNCEYHDFKDKSCKTMKANGKEILISLNLEGTK